MNYKSLAKQIVENKVGGLQIDGHIHTLFPDFDRFFVSEVEDAALAFAKHALPDCELRVTLLTNYVEVVRNERIPGVGEYPNVIGYAEIKHSLATAIVAAVLFAYDYLYS
jgi:hypothetical protein